ncbi:MAG: NADAR family protein [bacterium]|nr:NADAR family protein [bacterium]
MYFTIEELQKGFSQGKPIKFLFFWGHQRQKDGTMGPGCLSQWWPSKFVVKGIEYHSAEHWMMAEKARLFNDSEACEKILSAKSPEAAKKLGRGVSGYSEEIWKKNRYEIVKQGSLHKFSQNDDLKSYLLSTKKRVLVETSPVDKIWGIGLAQDDKKAKNPLLWKGLNLLGFALMEVRELLREEICLKES